MARLAYEKGVRKVEVGTLEELNVKPGDVVECVKKGFDIYHYPEGEMIEKIDLDGYWFGMSPEFCEGKFRIISRASDTPKLWRNMTDAEKGALLLAEHEGKTIQFLGTISQKWCDKPTDFINGYAYRVKPETVRDVVEIHGGDGYGLGYEFDRNMTTQCTHRITFETVNGKPDCSTIKMEELD